MREIKFRVWHKNEKRWLDPWAEEDPMLSLKDCGEGCEVFLYERDSGDWSNKNCLMKDIVIQQYTGLKDKNGVEIFEGDIVTADTLICLVEWQGVGWKATWKKQRGTETQSGSPDLNFRRHEVIGNIHENPELLEAK